jgi:hypothetical protein
MKHGLKIPFGKGQAGTDTLPLDPPVIFQAEDKVQILAENRP